MMQEQTMYMLVSPSMPKLLEHEDLDIFENRTYFKHTHRLLHIFS